MSNTAVADRIRADYMEMPGLELTLRQAVRLWTIEMDDCRFAVDALVDSGFLKWTPRRTLVRTGAAFQSWQSDTIHVPVGSILRGNKSV